MALSIAEDFHTVRKLIATLSDRVDALENRLGEGFKRIDVRFDVVEGKIERLGRRLDQEIEARHKSSDRVSKLQGKVKF